MEDFLTSLSKQKDRGFCDVASKFTSEPLEPIGEDTLSKAWTDIGCHTISHIRFSGLILTSQRTGLPPSYRKTIAAIEDIDSNHPITAPGKHHTCSKDYGFCGAKLAKVLPFRRGSHVLR